MKRDAAESLTHNYVITNAMNYWSRQKYGENHIIYFNAGLVIGDDVELDIGIYERTGSSLLEGLTLNYNGDKLEFNDHETN